MCGVCGCSEPEHESEPLAHAHSSHALEHSHAHHYDPARAHDHVHPHGHDHAHAHDNVHAHGHDHAHAHDRDSRLIRLEHDLLHKNSLLAGQNRAWFQGRAVLAINLVSSPGSGKTTLLERTIAESGLRSKLLVIQGDQATDRDAARIRGAGARAVQINTGTGCHLDAAMVARGVAELDPPAGSILAIENVGNLVCPALFDLGERARVAVLSVTEGADKPLKYPYLFRGTQLVLLNKTDLLPYVDFDLDACKDLLRQVNPDVEMLAVSAKTGSGLDAWYAWLTQRLAIAPQQTAQGAAP